VKQLELGPLSPLDHLASDVTITEINGKHKLRTMGERLSV